MAIVTEREAREAALRHRINVQKSADTILRESAETYRTSFDVFLSHSRLDSEVILGVKVIIEATGSSVYVDWIDDPQMDRSSVTVDTAEKLRVRMKQSKSLFYAHSMNSTKSRWMPWELGYFDGFNGNVAIFPIAGAATPVSNRGEEYLGLYPYVDVTGRNVNSPGTLYIHRNERDYAGYGRWREGADKLRPRA